MDFEFTLSEMLEMENMFKELEEGPLAPQFCEKLASSFSLAPSRAGKQAITPRQVKSWFQDRLKKSRPRVASSNMALKLFADLSDASASFGATESSQKLKGNASDLSELIFEALSSKDNAWYDVASFLNYRVVCSGELEVRVRFAGFRNTDDEWVNVRRAVRERSIPLESSECQRVKVGDLVLCFQEREERAVYCDAHIVEINRKLHDTNGCRCTFVVRYDHDDFEEEVRLDRLCGRPTP
ncbi:hypothetical protein Peur_039701 [Populus x canadensis]|uniref:Homeobox domain-containing protein n=2 Tax=Populus deltoides TaxID=3696 RepID=A0A8T2ZU28_POPDE|nr:hypothetical protein H0E87_002111 [Populus deltoides]